MSPQGLVGANSEMKSRKNQIYDIKSFERTKWRVLSFFRTLGGYEVPASFQLDSTDFRASMKLQPIMTTKVSSTGPHGLSGLLKFQPIMATTVPLDVTVPRTFGLPLSLEIFNLFLDTVSPPGLSNEAIQKDEPPIRNEKNLCESAYTVSDRNT